MSAANPQRTRSAAGAISARFDIVRLMPAPDDDGPIAAAILAGGRARRLADTRGTELVVARTGRRYEPRGAVYAESRAAPIHARNARSDLQASVLPPEIRVEEIGREALATYDPDGLLFVNVNTPHDYERARGLIELGAKPMQDRITE